MKSKLVRDKIPDIIRQSGREPDTYIAGDGEYREKLREKLLEECWEYLKDEKTEELADILEVIYALAFIKNICQADLEQIRQKKKKNRGGFTRKIILKESK